MGSRHGTQFLQDVKAEKNTRSVKGHDSSIKQIKEQYRPLKSRLHSRQSCYRCGKTNHAANDCKFKDATCHTCGKKGHIVPVCQLSLLTDHTLETQPVLTPVLGLWEKIRAGIGPSPTSIC